jgi:Tfp pilus assembly protein PilF
LWPVATIVAAIFVSSAMAYFGADLVLRGRPAAPFTRPNGKPAPELYMKGLYAWHTRTPTGLSDAITDFSEVILRDPDYAPAYVGLADCYALMPEFGGMTPAQAYPQAKVAAERAIALDDRLAGAHRALAFVDFWWSHDVAGSRREFERSLRLDPSQALTHHWYANTLAMAGDFPKAIAEIDEAERLDPSTTAIRADKALVLFHAGRAGEAIDILKAIALEQPAFAPTHRYLSVIYFAQADDPDGIAEMAAAARLGGEADALPVADAAAKGYRQAGHSGMMRAVLAEQSALFRTGDYSPFALAESYATVDPDRSFALLHQSLALREPMIMGLRVHPPLRPLHGDPRFAALIAAAHLPPLNS